MNQTNISPEERQRQAEETKKVVREMLESLNRHVIEGQEEYWTDEAKWRGPAGAGTKNSLKEFQQGWQKPFLNAFPEKQGTWDIFIAEGEYAAATGVVTSKHTGEFMGKEGDGREISLRYMDFWQVKDGKIVDNWVLLDLIDFFRQYDIDLLDGKGWDNKR